MRLGLGSYAYAWAIGIPGYPPPAQPMDAFALLKRAAQLGVRVVQIADNLPLHALPSPKLNALHRDADALGISIEVGTRGIAPDHLRRYLDLAQRFGSPILRIVIDTNDCHPTPDEIVQTLCPLMPDFERAGVTLAIENHDRFKARDLVDMMQRISSPRVGICLDTANSLGAGEGLKTVIDVLGSYTVNLHIKDIAIRRHRSMLGFEITGTPAGGGQIDIPKLLASLPEPTYPMSAILELWPPPEADSAATIAKEDAWVQSSITYLRGLIGE